MLEHVGPPAGNTRENAGCPIYPAFKAIMLAIGMNAVLPGRIAELLKPTFLMKQIVLPMSAGLAAVFYRAHG